ncbi:hypothetical protein Ahy_Scaffold1g107376 [Arachis hypogaea]|uniref:Uncharacterized protein n=1 Tax=Arachis hypogaea TaxID=3818 RepID=A0A444WVQ1_ARAHY|nr:hypothetical protein Ahy_Scaffold1g107376 [Arachis hypogaea]
MVVGFRETFVLLLLLSKLKRQHHLVILKDQIRFHSVSFFSGASLFFDVPVSTWLQAFWKLIFCREVDI